jgi:hypothetical protein
MIKLNDGRKYFNRRIVYISGSLPVDIFDVLNKTERNESTSFLSVIIAICDSDNYSSFNLTTQTSLLP